MFDALYYKERDLVKSSCQKFTFETERGQFTHTINFLVLAAEEALNFHSLPEWM